MSGPTKISGLPTAGALDGTEQVPMVQAAATKKSLLSTIADWIIKTYTGFLQSGTGAGPRSLQDKEREIVSVADFKNTDGTQVVGDGVQISVTGRQAAIDAMAARVQGMSSGGGIVWCPPGDYRGVGLVLKSGVTLKGAPGSKTGSTSYGTIFRSDEAGIVVDSPATSLVGAGLDGIAVYGPGASLASKGIRLQIANGCKLQDVFVDHFADEGVLVMAGAASHFLNVKGQNLLLNRTRAAKTGAFDLGGTDHYCHRCEITASSSIEGTISDANLYVCAWVIRNANNMLVDCIGEISDVGFHVLANSGSLNKFVGCRADLNYGHGWEVYGGNNMFSACHAYRNGQATNNTYDGFYLAATTGGSNVFSSCRSSGTAADANKPRYGFNDNFNGSTVSQRNAFSACNGSANATGLYNMVAFQGSTPQLPHHVNPAADADATPTVDNSTFMRLSAYTTETVITAFDDPVGAQWLFLLGNAKVTLKHSSTLFLNNHADKRLRDSALYIFQRYNGVWYELDTYPQPQAFTMLFDDFIGIAGNAPDATKWAMKKGSDGACATAVLSNSYYRGTARLVTGADAGGTMALNGSQMHNDLLWLPQVGGLFVEFRLVHQTSVANMATFIGFTDQVAALEMPFELGAGDALTSNASNAVGVLYDTNADTDNWWLVGVATDVDATAQNSGVAPVAETPERWRIELTTGGVATFFRNGAKVGVAMAGAVTPGAALTPVVATLSRGAASRSVYVDQILVDEARPWP